MQMAIRRCSRFASGLFGLILGLSAGLLVARTGSRRDTTRNVAPDRCPPTVARFSDSLADTYWRARTQPHPSIQEDPLSVIGLEKSGPLKENSRGLVFAGVMTARKYLGTRAVAVYETWGKELPGKVAFFTSEGSRHPGLPLVALPGVDDSYPPQKKSFLMLQYMWQNYGDRFDWFLRADDDLYVRTDRLAQLLRSVDSSRAFFVGQAGRGNQEEFGSLSLEYDENFCMGGPGVIFSRETLARVAPHIKFCLKNLYTTHEDVELGRCVRRFARVSCTWSYEMQTILYHNSSGKDAFTSTLKQKEVHRAITLHPVKQHKHLYRIHNYMKGLKIHNLQQDWLELHRDLSAMSAQLGRPVSAVLAEGPFSSEALGDSQLFGSMPSLNKYHPRSEEDLVRWEFISRSLYSDGNLNPRRRIESPLKEGLDDVIREVMEMINQFSRQRGRVIEFKEILYGYHRVNPVYGADHILDMLLVYKKYRGKKMTVPVRRHAYLQQQFTGLEIREILDGVEVVTPRHSGVQQVLGGADGTEEVVGGDEGLVGGVNDLVATLLATPNQSSQPPHADDDKVVNFILPLSGRLETFKRFISVFEEVCLARKEAVTLTVVLFPSDLEKGGRQDSVNATLTVVSRLQARHSWTRILAVPVFDTFARALALDAGVSRISEPNDLLFFVDVDMVFTGSVLKRIRSNTVRGKTAYFPIVYSEFDPDIVHRSPLSPDHFRIDDVTGYWRQFGFGIASVYKTDLIKVGGFDVSIRGWGKEDVSLYEKFVSSSANMTVMRAVDPGLVHVFHVVDCDPSLPEGQLQMCRATRADTYGSVRQLSDLLFTSALETYINSKIGRTFDDRNYPPQPC